jgi:hypothetical protein
MIRVRCIINDLSRLPNTPVRQRLETSIHIEGVIEPLSIGTEYDVWALVRGLDRGLWVVIDSIPGSYFPSTYPAEFFEFICMDIPNGWRVCFESSKHGIEIDSISFPEWTSDKHFYERLIDGDPSAVNTYNRRRNEQLVRSK